MYKTHTIFLLILFTVSLLFIITQFYRLRQISLQNHPQNLFSSELYKVLAKQNTFQQALYLWKCYNNLEIDNFSYAKQRKTFYLPDEERHNYE